MKRLISLLLAAALLCALCGCNAKDPVENPTGGTSGSDSTGETVAVDFAQSDADMFTNRDLEGDYNENNGVVIQLTGDSAAADSNTVKISESTVTITQEGVYIISGTLNDGMIVVDADNSAKLQIVLNSASVTSAASAALYVKEADKVFVTLAEGTENALSNGGSFTAIDENNIDGAVYSQQDITFNGSGILTVTSPVGHGIVCKDDLIFTGGNYTINSASHGIDANDSVRVTNAAVTIDSGKDGVHTENADDTTLGFFYQSGGTLSIESEGDGISAGAYMQIAAGTVDVSAGGGSENGEAHSSDHYGDFMGGGMGGMGGGRPGPRAVPDSGNALSVAASESDSSSRKGLKADGSILISDGSITIDSADDAVHAGGSITINGGSFEIASGDDGFHADETLHICAGAVDILECYEGLEALDIVVSGGNVKLKASDDGLNAAGGNDSSGTGGFHGGDLFGGMGGGPGSAGNGSVTISGGNLYINASGDGIDANGTLTISGGYTVVVGPTNGDTATLDYDVSGVITGGTFVGTGASMMAQTFSDSKQGVFAVQVGSQPANTQITLTDSDGNTVISYTPELSFQVVILSSPDIVAGESYTITVGEVSGTFEAT